MADETAHLTRQLEIIPLDVLGNKITIVGAGAIGSFVTLSLAKMGFCDITVFDDDNIDIENMNCQFFRFSDIGKPKVEALKELVKDFTGVEIVAKNEQYTGGMFQGIVISAVDSMEARRLVWENHKEVAIATKLVIDPRMGAETALCYAMSPMDPKDVTSYEKTLYSDENAVHERCTAKSTMYTVLALSSHVCKVVKDYLCADKRYTRVCEWSIKENVQKCWPNKKKEED
jgi:molybdopterin/thiamine biosynthesis adenylyltransferase